MTNCAILLFPVGVLDGPSDNGPSDMAVGHVFQSGCFSNNPDPPYLTGWMSIASRHPRTFDPHAGRGIQPSSFIKDAWQNVSEWSGTFLYRCLFMECSHKDQTVFPGVRRVSITSQGGLSATSGVETERMFCVCPARLKVRMRE